MNIQLDLTMGVGMMFEFMSRIKKSDYKYSIESFREFDKKQSEQSEAPSPSLCENKFYNKIHTNSKRSELKRVQDFITDFRVREDNWLKQLVRKSGIYQGYINKERRLLVELGTTNHPYPEEEM